MYKLKVRNIGKEELDQIVIVERESWPEDLRASREKFESRLNIFPDGVFGVYVNDRLFGVSTSIVVDYNLSDEFDWNKITGEGYGTTHNINGNALYVISVGTSQTQKLNHIRKYLKENGYKGLGTELVERQKDLARRLRKQYVLLTARVPGYRKHYEKNKTSIEDYVKLTVEKNGRAEPLDPEIRFYKRCGLEIAKIIPDAEEDYESMNYGLIMYWENKS